MANLYLGLVHYPIYNKNMKVIATAVTNFDIHDIARTARTYDVKGYFLIHPLNEQAKIIQKITDYWQNGYGRVYNPDRCKALEIASYCPSIAEAAATIEQIEKTKPVIITTDARTYDNTVSYGFVRNLLAQGDKPVLLLFGTGYGIEQETMKRFDYILEPIVGAGFYNHLCVRSAAAIIMDRIAGENWWDK